MDGLDRPGPGNTGQPNAGGDGAADGNAGGNQAVANETKYTQPGNRTLVDLSINENSDLNSRMLGDYTQPDPPETSATEELVMNSDDDPVLKPLLHTPEINASDQLVFRDDAGLNTAIDSLEKNAAARDTRVQPDLESRGGPDPRRRQHCRPGFPEPQGDANPVRRLRGLYRRDINGTTPR